jgi:predicted nucleic acid-binding protein
VASAFCSIPLGAAMVAGEGLASVVPGLLFMLYLLVASAALLRGLALWFRHQDPRRPRPPRRRIAKRSRVPREPQRQIHEIAHNCVICGGPLTNHESMRARVGSTCIKRYGPRFKLIENPDHRAWRQVVAAAETERGAEQSRLDARFERSVALHWHQERAWVAEAASTAGRERRRCRKAGSRLVTSSVASAPLLLVGIGCALALN